MSSNELVSELQRLQLMINAVRKALREDDSEAARLLLGVAERLMLLKEVAEASALTAGDLVVHLDHGIGRYEGLKTLEIQEGTRTSWCR